jgi:beta-galactosidase
MKTTFPRILLCVHLLLAVASLNLFAASTTSPRERLLLDSGWKFHLGNDWGIGQNLSKAGSGSGPASMWFGDASWRTVNLPHDWAVELPFDKSADSAHGFKALGHGFPSNSVAWYRRSFDLPKADAGKRLWLEFDGVYRNCDVFVNGWFIGHHVSGYSRFRYDITDVADYGGNNVVAVKVDASDFEGWFYEGAGIYRHVWLVKTAPVAIAPDGIFVRSLFKKNIPKGPANIIVQADLLNESTNLCAKGTVKCEIISPDGKSVAKFKESTRILPRGTRLALATKIGSYELWSPESPKLYKLVTTVEIGGQVVDCQETEFGIRTVAFDPGKGFLLNGQPYKIKGTCNHQDMAGVGVALPDALQCFRVKKLKEMGCNADRTSHNVPTPELLDACDRLGLLVLDENRLVGSDPANLERLKDQIKRDRNHPSVFAWSLGNEEWNAQGTAQGAAVIRTMQDLAHRLDPTRECTAAINGAYGDEGFVTVLDVKGFNYNLGGMDAYHTNHLGSNYLGTETASTVTTRGIYTNDTAKGYVSAYDYITTRQSPDFPNPVTWGETAEDWWSFYDARPWSSGGFAWTGFDYRGEPTPYSWPCINSHFGIMDMCGFPKDNFYYYQACWTDKPVLHLLPHWNWPGREGQNIDVWCYSNCKEVELFLNGRSLGRKTMKKDSHLEWEVPYSPGTLSAKGYSDGKEIAETKAETTGAPAAIQITPNRSTIHADGEDVSVFTVAVTDAQGRVVPGAADLIHFELSGPQKILGVANGDPSCHEPDVYLPVWTNYSVAANDGWHWEKISNPWNPNLPETAVAFDDSTWSKADVESASGPLGNGQHAVFRGHINVTEAELASEIVELCFGSINGGGNIYLNGQKAGESHDGGMVVALDAKRLLHPGNNTVAVVVSNYSESGGLNKGVSLRMQDKAILPEWKRSVFNGLAQIIVQSTRDPGEIRLTATAEGLTPATVSVQSQPCTPRPSVP